MMKKAILTFLMVSLVGGFLFAQQGIKLYEKGITEKKPVPYPHLREADVMWSKKIWRVIDLREKMNHPLYYGSKTGDRESFINVVMGELKAGNLNAYEANIVNLGDLTVATTQTEINTAMGGKTDTIQTMNAAGQMVDTTIVVEPQWSEVKQLMLYEEWFFDKKHSTMQVRIHGICPIRISLDPNTGQLQKRMLFWIHYNDFRNTFANHEVFNRFNDAHRVSFDDLFMQRRFSSYIVAESNVYDNRTIQQYMLGRAALFESERIKEELRNFEHDLWEF